MEFLGVLQKPWTFEIFGEYWRILAQRNDSFLESYRQNMDWTFSLLDGPITYCRYLYVMICIQRQWLHSSLKPGWPTVLQPARQESGGRTESLTESDSAALQVVISVLERRATTPTCEDVGCCGCHVYILSMYSIYIYIPFFSTLNERISLWKLLRIYTFQSTLVVPHSASMSQWPRSGDSTWGESQKIETELH